MQVVYSKLAVLQHSYSPEKAAPVEQGIWLYIYLNMTPSFQPIITYTTNILIMANAIILVTGALIPGENTLA